MIIKEQIVDLTLQDIEGIKKKSKFLIIILFFVTILFSVIISIIVAQSNHIFMFVGSIFILFPLGMIIFVYIGTKRDLLNGQKRILTGTITRKFEQTSGPSSKSSSITSYYFEMDYEKIKVENKDYATIHEGDLVEIQMTIKFKIVLEIKKIQDSTNMREYIKTGVLKNEVKQEISPTFHIERIVDMDDDEYNRLKIKKNKRLVRFFIINAIIAYILCYLIRIIFIITLTLTHLITNKELIFQIHNYIIPCFVIFLFAWIFKIKLLPLINDINSRTKKIIETIIEDKIESNVKIISGNWKVTSSIGEFKYIYINNKNYPVSHSQYKLFEGGDKIEAHFTINSNILIKIVSKEDAKKTIVFLPF